MKHVMFKRNGTPALLLGIGMIFVGLMFLAGCSWEGPTDFTREQSVDQPSLHSSQLKILYRPYPLAKTTSGEDFFYGEQFFEAAVGGQLQVGDEACGYSSLSVPANALFEDKVLSMKVPKYGDLITTLSETALEAQGTQFATPVTVVLSYKGADLTGVVEEEIRAWYYNENIAEWEYVGGTVNVAQKKVTFQTNHFSRYGLNGGDGGNP